MAERSRIFMIALILWALGSCPGLGMEWIETKLLAAMPLLNLDKTQLILGMGPGEIDLTVGRAVLSCIAVRAEASSAGAFDLNVRFHVPPQLLAPAFFALELDTKSLTGFMTLFFGSVCIDLGRTWFQPSRWAVGQLIVHPKLAIVVGGIQESTLIVPLVGWRIFPSASGQWEIDLLFAGTEIRLSLGGYL